MIVDEDIYKHLEHFGIKGMQWGVRNEDDTSGSSNKKSETKQERNAAKAKKFTDKANEIQKQIDGLKNKPTTSSYQLALNNRKIKELSQEKGQALADAEAKQQGKLTDRQKKIIIGGAVAGGIVLALGSYHMAQSGQFNQMATKGRDFLNGPQPPFKIDPSLAKKDMSVDEIMHSVVPQINPKYKENGLGTKMNCRRCTYAYEMRRRGHDVEATRTTNAFGQNVIGIHNAVTPDGDPLPTGVFGITRRMRKEQREALQGKRDETPISDMVSNMYHHGRVPTGPDGIFSELAKQPNGARGELDLTWGIGGGHSVVWEIVGGKPVIFDTQDGKKFESLASLHKAYNDKGLDVFDAGIMRLDNLPLNQNFLMRWVSNA